jgi:hypothetical protein
MRLPRLPVPAQGHRSSSALEMFSEGLDPCVLVLTLSEVTRVVAEENFRTMRAYLRNSDGGYRLRAESTNTHVIGNTRSVSLDCNRGHCSEQP